MPRLVLMGSDRWRLIAVEVQYFSIYSQLQETEEALLTAVSCGHRLFSFDQNGSCAFHIIAGFCDLQSDTHLLKAMTDCSFPISLPPMAKKILATCDDIIPACS